MGQRHKHADVIIAWANGAEIECRDTPTSPWTNAHTPSWYENCEYRVKPPVRKYRVALFISCGDDGETYTATANTHESADIYATSKRFIRWLTDWIEYEE